MVIYSFTLIVNIHIQFFKDKKKENGIIDNSKISLVKKKYQL